MTKYIVKVRPVTRCGREDNDCIFRNFVQSFIISVCVCLDSFDLCRERNILFLGLIVFILWLFVATCHWSDQANMPADRFVYHSNTSAMFSTNSLKMNSVVILQKVSLLFVI